MHLNLTMQYMLFLFLNEGNKQGVVPKAWGPDTKIRAFDCSKHGQWKCFCKATRFSCYVWEHPICRWGWWGNLWSVYFSLVTWTCYCLACLVHIIYTPSWILEVLTINPSLLFCNWKLHYLWGVQVSRKTSDLDYIVWVEVVSLWWKPVK